MMTEISHYTGACQNSRYVSLQKHNQVNISERLEDRDNTTHCIREGVSLFSSTNVWSPDSRGWGSEYRVFFPIKNLPLKTITWSSEKGEVGSKSLLWRKI